MSVETKHPLYERYVAEWVLLRDSYRGEAQIKSKGIRYLPPTSSQIADDLHNPQALGARAYEAYKSRAVYYDYVKTAVEHAVGRLHTKPPEVRLPEAMEFLRDSATLGGDSLEGLLRRIHEQQIAVGRVGLLLDVGVEPVTGAPRPYIAVYHAESIINWDDSSAHATDLQTSLVVLKEHLHERIDDFQWESFTQYRALLLQEGQYVQQIWRDGQKSTEVSPKIRGQNAPGIPFVFVNSSDILSQPAEEAPLSGLARLALTIYRGEADYRQNLFMQGQDTLVLIGALREEDPSALRIGTGAVIQLPEGSDARYVGVNSKGLSEQREALVSDRALAREKAGGILDATSREKESGEALRIRVAAQTVSLTQIAQTGAFALEKILKTCAEWMGANPEEVQVVPNLDFVQERFESRELVEIMTAKNMGAPVSLETVHSVLANRGFTSLPYEEEVEKMEKEGPGFGLVSPDEEVL